MALSIYPTLRGLSPETLASRPNSLTLSDSAILGVIFFQAPVLRTRIVHLVREFADLSDDDNISRRRHVSEIGEFCRYVQLRGGELRAPYFPHEMTLSAIFLSFAQAREEFERIDRQWLSMKERMISKPMFTDRHRIFLEFLTLWPEVWLDIIEKFYYTGDAYRFGLSLQSLEDSVGRWPSAKLWSLDSLSQCGMQADDLLVNIFGTFYGEVDYIAE